jgi:glycosyltransferase involved in cell wall biosynthesis
LFAPYPKICIARWLVQAAAGMGVPPEQLVYVPYGIKHGKYRITTPIDDRPLQVSMLYHNHFAKAPLVGLEALAEVQRRMPGVRAIAFGTEDPVTAIPPGVEFVKSPPQDVLVHDIYNHSRVFLCSSTIEGFGFCSVEAMACGAALVTTDNKGSDDFAVHDDTALVAPPDDPTALADHVETLLRDDDRRIAIATRGTAHARQFDWDVSAHRLETFFEQYAADPDHYRRATRPTVEYLLPPPIKERR